MPETWAGIKEYKGNTPCIFLSFFIIKYDREMKDLKGTLAAFPAFRNSSTAGVSGDGRVPRYRQPLMPVPIHESKTMINPRPPVPIVITAFGTNAGARDTYGHLAARIQTHFPGHEILCAFSSRILKESKGGDHPPVSSPREILEALHRQHHPWAVVQSLHLIGGHEFIRLVAETDKSPIRTAIGLPLLSSPADFTALCAGLAPLINAHPNQAVLLVGHGTDHPAWCAYPTLHYFLRRHFGPRVFVGVIEEGCPSRAEVIADIRAAGYREVCIVPLLLVAGMHFQRDLAADCDHSWLNRMAGADIRVEIMEQGIGLLPAVADLFCRHIEEALTTIPDNHLFPEKITEKMTVHSLDKPNCL